ncbi:MAG: hypothetical protein ACFFBP_05195 [Promethearchaeota archaeon]
MSLKDGIDSNELKIRRELRKIARERQKFATGITLGFLSISLVFYNLIYFFSEQRLFFFIILIVLSVVINVTILTLVTFIFSSIILSIEEINDFNKKYNNSIHLDDIWTKSFQKPRRFNNILSFIILFLLNPIIISLLIVIEPIGFYISFVVNLILNLIFIHTSKEFLKEVSNYLSGSKKFIYGVWIFSLLIPLIFVIFYKFL